MKFLALPICLLFVFFASFSTAQDCEGVFDSLYFELVPIKNLGVGGGTVAEGSNINVEARSVDFDLFSFQYTIAYDTTKFSFVSIDRFNTEIQGAVNSFESSKGRIGVIWTQIDA